jgi:NAD(P)-dependent dehydrogenase (short-subunit alcohol dehydrogenase family)
VEGITKSAAIELAGTGVRVNIVGPGPTETGMFNRFAQTKENKANFLEAHIPTKRTKRLQMPSCSLALTRPLISSAHPWRWMEECSRGDAVNNDRRILVHQNWKGL